MSFLMPKLTAVARSLAIVGALAAATAAHAVTYTEVADAGQTVAGAQKTTGAAGALTDIFGSILSSTDADLYVINITNVATFSASTVNALSSNLDTQLFLLKLDGTPVYFNDDANGFVFTSTLGAGSALGPTTTGQYILGISISGYLPINSSGQLLFIKPSDTTMTVGPASGLSPSVLGGFDSSYVYDQEFGAYDIQLTGASVALPVPEPTTYALMAAGLGAVGYLRRRRASTSNTTAA